MVLVLGSWSPQYWRVPMPCGPLAGPLVGSGTGRAAIVALKCEGRAPAFLETRTLPFPGDKEPGVPGRPSGTVPGGWVLAAPGVSSPPGEAW